MKKKAQTKLKNYVSIVLDASSSMQTISRQTVDTLNSLIRTIRDRSTEEGQETQICLVTFADQPEVKIFPTDARRLKELGYGDYRPDGWTALWDGTGLAIETLEQMPDADQEDVSFLVMVITDGEENRSLKYNSWRLRQKLEAVERTGRWTVAFQVPPGARRSFCQRFGIAEENVREWENTSAGLAETETVNVASLSTYFSGRSRGIRASKSFYDVTTNLAQVGKKTIQRNLDDISGDFKVLTVDKEMAVKEFVEAKTRKTYIIGSAYYQLMKPEKVQPQKAVLLMEKGKQTIWGGDQARDLIGLPTDGTSHAKVTPGNHSNYDVFVQSTSVNRKLPRGTKVLVNTKQSTNLDPTWK